MNRFAWLLVLPWTVVLTTGPFQSSNHPDPENWEVRYMGDPWVFSCPGKAKDSCFDFRDALNEAHEKRLSNEPPVRKIGFDTDNLPGSKQTIDTGGSNKGSRIVGGPLPSTGVEGDIVLDINGFIEIYNNGEWKNTHIKSVPESKNKKYSVDEENNYQANPEKQINQPEHQELYWKDDCAHDDSKCGRKP